MRAIQMTPALLFQEYRNLNWMAHTPVGHDSCDYFGGTEPGTVIGVPVGMRVVLLRLIIQ